MSRLLRTLAKIVVGGVFALALFWVGSMALVLIWSRLDQARPAESIVVLGAAQYDGRPSPVLKARLDHAISLWNRKLASVMVVTGGRAYGDTTSEAAVSRKYAIRHGVPDTAILVESQGRTTRESMAAVGKMLEQRGIKRVILVSDPFHMLRLWILSRYYGLIPYTSPTKTSPISPNTETRWRYMLSESIKAPLALFPERRM